MINISKGSNLYLVERESKKGKKYYALILKIQDVEILLSFIKKADYEFIQSLALNK